MNSSPFTRSFGRQTTGIIALLCLCVAGTLCAAPSLAEQKKTPYGPEVEKVLAEFAEKGVPAKTGQFKKHMVDIIQAINGVTPLSPEETATLNSAADKAVAEAVTIWKPRIVDEMRVLLRNRPASYLESNVRSWKADEIAQTRFVEHATRPDQLETWNAAVRGCLGQERSALWDKEARKRQAQREMETMQFVTPVGEKACSTLDKDIAVRIEDMVQSRHLTAQKGTALDEARKSVVEEIKKREMARTARFLQLLTDDAWHNVFVLHHGSVRLDIPAKADDVPEWSAAVKRILTPEELAGWEKEKSEKQKILEAEVVKGLQPVRGMYQDSYAQTLRTEATNIAEAASLSPEHLKLLETAGQVAVDHFMVEWEKKMVQSVSAMSERQRTQVYARRLGISVNLEGMNDPRQIPEWKKEVDEILSPEEKARWKTVVAERGEMMLRSFSRLALMEMDKRVFLSSAQREKLEPVAQERVKQMLSGRGMEGSQEFNLNESEFIEALVGVKADKVKPLLDETQWKHWQEAAKHDDGSRQRFSFPTVTKKPPPTAAKPVQVKGMKRPEPPSADSIISEHLHQESNKAAARNIASMQLRIEEAARLGSLPVSAVARLTTAAKGAVESTMTSWRSQMDNWVRSQLTDANAQNVRPRLESMGNVFFGYESRGPQDMPLWKSAMDEVMPPDKRKVWQQEQDGRREYQNAAMAQAVLYQMQRRCPITADQKKRLEPLLKKVVEEYSPDIQNWISGPWYFSSYYCMIPLGGVPEKELEKALGPEGMKQAKLTVLPQAQEYWEGIKQQHDQRMSNQNNNGFTITY